MFIAKLRKVDGLVMLAIPPALVDALGFSADQLVKMDIGDGDLVVKRARPRFTLDELLAQCDPDAPFSSEDRAWLDGHPVGRELI